MALPETKEQGARVLLAPLRRGVRVLEHVAEQPAGSTFRNIQRAVGGLGDASLSRLLAVLQDEGLLAKDELSGRYRLGDRMGRLAHRILASVPREQILGPVLQELAQSAGQSVGYWEGEGPAIRLKARCQMEESSSVPVFNKLNIRVTRHPCGQIYLAHQDSKRRRQLIRAASEEPAVQPDVFEARLDQIRADGFLIDPCETGNNIFRLGAAVYCGEDGPFAGALAIIAAGRQWPKQQIRTWKQQALTAAANATRLLGEQLGVTNA